MYPPEKDEIRNVIFFAVRRIQSKGNRYKSRILVSCQERVTFYLSVKKNNFFSLRSFWKVEHVTDLYSQPGSLF